MRKNPMLWDDAQAEGVLSPLERDPLESGPMLFDSAPHLLGLPDGESMLGLTRKNMPDEGASAAVHAVFDGISEALTTVLESNRASRIDLDHLSEDDLALLKDALGNGEVSMVLTRGEGDTGEAQIAETALPGVWMGRAVAEDASSHWLEVADAPFALRRLAITRPRKHLNADDLSPPEGAMNVVPVLAEIAERSANWQGQSGPNGQAENHVINFTLFPMSGQDAAFLASTLGEVGVTIMSGGYGVARVLMTAVPHVWAVQYLNGMGTTILDTIEIGDIPSCVQAGSEDFEDSRMRLTDIQDAYRGTAAS